MIDGEILPWKDGDVLPFAQLQRRIGRKTVGKTLLAEVPVVLVAYDLLEARRERHPPPTRSSSRRARLAEIVARLGLGRPVDRLADRRGRELGRPGRSCATSSRERQVEGMMLKRRGSPYRVGRVRGDWWKWKVNPLTVDAVLIAAQRGSGKRASLYTDYTFGVWDDEPARPHRQGVFGPHRRGDPPGSTASSGATRSTSSARSGR